MDPFVAEIRIFPFNFAPTGWAMCNGQLLPLSQNTALFSLLGTTYGGDGKSTFALPDLQDNAALGAGQGQGLSEYYLGQQSGVSAVSLIEPEMPAHTHFLEANNGFGNNTDPSSNSFSRVFGGGNMYKAPSGATIAMMDPRMIGGAGGSQPHNNMQPYLVLNFCIAMQGVFPPRPS
ncbi:MAG: tail fiber protein [Acidobacteriota bacterium]|nr:tail fiber protein [Acidobacteriota bacterium]